jgi:hypothetical protein
MRSFEDSGPGPLKPFSGGDVHRSIFVGESGVSPDAAVLRKARTCEI